MAKNSKNSYDPARDLVLSKVLVFHVSTADGSLVGAPGEGVESFAASLRQVLAEDGTKGPMRIAVSGAFVSKGAKGNALPRWVVQSDGTAKFSPKPEAGDVCLASAVGRMDPHVAATVYAQAAAYSAKVTAALAKRKAA